MEEVRHFKALVLEAAQERSDRDRDFNRWERTTGWSAFRNACRLVACFVDESLRGDFLSRRVAMTRRELDARGTDSEAKSYYEKVHELFNNEEFKPFSTIISDENYGDFFKAQHPLFPHQAGILKSGDEAKGKWMEWMKSLKKLRCNKSNIVTC